MAARGPTGVCFHSRVKSFKGRVFNFGDGLRAALRPKLK